MQDRLSAGSIDQTSSVSFRTPGRSCEIFSLRSAPWALAPWWSIWLRVGSSRSPSAGSFGRSCEIVSRGQQYECFPLQTVWFRTPTSLCTRAPRSFMRPPWTLPIYHAKITVMAPWSSRQGVLVGTIWWCSVCRYLGGVWSHRPREHFLTQNSLGWDLPRGVGSDRRLVDPYRFLWVSSLLAPWKGRRVTDPQ